MKNTASVINLIVICGPTASGKTGLGVKIALELDGEIISADSRQVYRRMDIGTGKDLDEYKTSSKVIPCHLVDIAEPAEVYTLYDYRKDFSRVFDAIRGRGKIPVMVGGSGLYIEAVLKNYNIPEVPENPVLRSELMTKEKDWLCDELRRIDPRRYSITDLSSKKRIVRALEIAVSLDGCEEILDQETPVKPVVLCTKWDREKLYKRIAVRLRKRLDEGMVDEVRRLVDEGISWERLSLFGMEYKQIARFLRNEIDYEQMVNDLNKDINHLAKRQETWFRGMERRGVTVNYIPEADFEEAKMVLIDNKILHSRWQLQTNIHS